VGRKRILGPSFRRVRGIPILFAGLWFIHGNLQQETTGRLIEGLKDTTFSAHFSKSLKKESEIFGRNR
jgi:hypothetical protein